MRLFSEENDKRKGRVGHKKVVLLGVAELHSNAKATIGWIALKIFFVKKQDSQEPPQLCTKRGEGPKKKRNRREEITLLPDR